MCAKNANCTNIQNNAQTMPDKNVQNQTPWTVYMIACADGTLYTGITNDLPRRFAQHENGTGAKYLRGRGPLAIVHTEICASRPDALRREAAIKALNKQEKLALINRA